jgi:hypothetical protein
MRPSTSVSLLALLLMLAAVTRDIAAAPARPATAPEKYEDQPWVVAGEWMPSEEQAVQDALIKSRVDLNDYQYHQNPPRTWVPDVDYIRQRLWTDLSANDPKFKTLKWKHAQEAIIGDGIWLRRKSWNDFLDAGMPQTVVDKLKALDRKTFTTRDECRAALEAVLDKEEMQSYQQMVLNQANGNAHTVQIETQDQDPLVGRMYRAAVRVEVSAFVRPEFDAQERQFQESLRQHRAAQRQKILAVVVAGLVALLLVVAGYLRMEDATKGYCTRLLRTAVVAFVALAGAAGIWLLRRWL